MVRELIAAAGFYIPLAPRWHRKSFGFASRFPMPTTHEQTDFVHAKSFVLCSFQPAKPSVLLSPKSVCPGVGQPLSSVSGRKRYNTLDFPKENRVPTGMLSPLLETQSRGAAPLWTPVYFPRKWYPNCKNAV